MPKIFISYSRKNKDFVERLVTRLRELNFDVWYDIHNITAARKWRPEIEKAIMECDVFIFVMTEHSLASKVVHEEVSIAIKYEKAFIPLLLDHGWPLP